MINLTINKFQPIVYLPLFWINFCLLSGCLLIQVKFSRFSTPEAFHKRFRPIFLRTFFVILGIL